MINFEITSYNGRFPEQHYRLFLEAWEEYFATGAQSKIPRETFDNLFVNNPFGESYFAVARDKDRMVGALAAIPFTVAADEGNIFTAYQISVIMVSPRYRKQGIFSRMLCDITDYLREKPSSLTYVFPNNRSKPGSIKNGYLPRLTLPTRIYFPSSMWGTYSFSRESANIIRKGNRRFLGREISIKTAGEKLRDYHPPFPHFQKEGKYLEWRYFEPEGSSHFYFHHISEPTGKEDILLVSTRHSYGKRVFTVLLEIFNLRNPGIKPSSLPGLLMKLSLEKGFPLLYTNEPHLPTAILSPAWAISLPHFLNPRPIELLVPSTEKNKELEKYFLQLDFATADWLGFL